MKKLTVTFNVPDFYKFADLKAMIEVGTEETCAIVESACINGLHKTIVTDMEVESFDEKSMSFTLVEKPSKK